MLSPQTITYNLIAEINTTLFGSEPPDEFTLKKWEAAARALIRKSATEAAEGYQLLGLLGVFSNDIDVIDSNFQKSLRLAPNSQLIAENYAAAFLNVLHSSKSYERMVEYGLDRMVGQRAESDMNVIALLAGSGHVDQSSRLLRGAKEGSKFVITQVSNLTMEWILGLGQRVHEAGLDEQAVVQWINCAETVLRDQLAVIDCKPWRICAEYIYLDECGAMIDYHAPVSVEQAVELNFAIADALAQLDLPTIQCLPSISVVPYAS